MAAQHRDAEEDAAIAKTRKPVDSAKLLVDIQQALEDAKAFDITILDLKGKTSIADYMVVASGTSQRHVKTVADRVIEKLKEDGIRRVTSEGREQSDWVLVDAISVIVHIFRPEARNFYNLEKMWSVPASQDTEETAQR